MKKFISTVVGFLLLVSFSAKAQEELSIEKQLVGIVGAISGTVKTETRELKAGDKIYLNETIYAAAGSGTQILLLDQSTFTIGEDSEVVMDTFVFDPATNDGKIVASVKQGSLKVISGLISKKNPDSLTVEVPEGTLGSRGTEFQTIVSKGKTDTLLIGPGKNNTLGMRPGAVLVGNSFGRTLLDNPYSMTSMTKEKAPGQAKKNSKNQLKKFNKKMKALRVAKLSPDETKSERKQIRKQLKKELKALGFEKEEIKTIIKENIKKDKSKNIIKEKKIGNIFVREQTLKDFPPKELRNIIDKGKKEIKDGIIICISSFEGKVGVAVGVTEKLTSKYDAVNLVKVSSEVLGGKGGGGRKDFAQAGGVDQSKIEQAFEAVRKKLN